MSQPDPKTLEKARALLKKGDLDGAVRVFIQANAIDEAARALAAAARYMEAADLLLASVGEPVNKLSQVRDPQLRARAAQAASLLRQGNMHRAADDVEDALEATSQHYAISLPSIGDDDEDEKTQLQSRADPFDDEDEKTEIGHKPPLFKPGGAQLTNDPLKRPVTRAPPSLFTSLPTLPKEATTRPSEPRPADPKLSATPMPRTTSRPQMVAPLPPEAPPQRTTSRPQMVAPLPPESPPRRNSPPPPPAEATHATRDTDEATPPRLPAARPASSGHKVAEPGFETGTVMADRYKLGPLIGRGGFARVFQATDLELNAEIAIKVFDRMDDKTLLARFKQELLSSRQIAHPNVLRIFDIGTHAERKYLTMELLVGQDLKDRLMQPIAFSESLDLLIQACRGLEAAHAVGVIHRDIKPQNLFITAQKVVKLMDFGIAKLQAAARLTSPGMGVGTPEFMAPEQILDSSTVSPATDLYSIGVTAYRMLTGRVPFQDKDMMKLLKKQLYEAAPPPRAANPKVPAQLDAIVVKLLSKRPEERFQRAGEVADAFAAIRARFATAH